MSDYMQQIIHWTAIRESESMKNEHVIGIK